MPMRNLKLPKLKFRVADSDRSATAKFKVAKYKKPGVGGLLLFDLSVQKLSARFARGKFQFDVDLSVQRLSARFARGKIHFLLTFIFRYISQFFSLKT